jgi:hypothetical protein
MKYSTLWKQLILEIHPFLQHATEVSDADRSTENWRSSKLQELQFIGLTVWMFPLHFDMYSFFVDHFQLTHYQAALVAGLIGPAFAWPNIASGPWSTKASWQASFMLISGSITITAQQSIS